MLSSILNTSIRDDNNMFEFSQIGGDDDNEDMDVDDSYAESDIQVILKLCRVRSDMINASTLTCHI